MNDCFKVLIGGHYEKQIFPKKLLQLYVQELHNNMVSPSEESGPKDARYKENNSIIIDYILRNIFQLSVA